MQDMLRAHEQTVDFLAQGTTSETVASFEASAEAKPRVAELILKEKQDGLTLEEAIELNHFVEIEHLMRLVKVRARQYIAP